MTFGIGVIGCGSIARRAHIPAFNNISSAQVVALASRSRTSADLAASECEGVVYERWEEIVDSHIVHGVDICSPNAYHRDQAVAAAEAGKHVLVEKPIARTVDEANDMIEAARDKGVVLHVVQNIRYIPTIIAAHNVVADGRLGDIVGVRAAFGHSGPKDWAPDSTWFFDADLSGGGALIDLGVHIIDAVRYVTGLEAESVSAMTFGGESTEDAAQVIVGFAGGAVGSIHASWVARPAPDMMLTVFGREGTLHFDTRTPLTFRPAMGDSEKVALPKVDTSPYLDFVRAATGAAPEGPFATGEDGRAALAIIEAAYESARARKTVGV